MSNRITVYGKLGDSRTKHIVGQLNSLSLMYDLVETRASNNKLADPEFVSGESADGPRVEVECANGVGSVFLSNPDDETLRQTLYAEEVLGVTSYWV